jgi:hypothetical protein
MPLNAPRCILQFLYAVGSVGYVMDSMNVSIKEDVLRVILVKKVKIEDALTQLEILGREKPEYTEHIKKIFMETENIESL